MDIIINFFIQILSSIGPFILLLGILIFIHEFGHFIVAKFCGVRVEVFSLGFGKKILQYKKGDTCYCVSIVPLGGYIKMYGEAPGTKIEEKDKHLAFSHKNVYQRIAIVIAGPLMNLFLAAFIFSGLAYFGEQVPDAYLGDIASHTVAYKSGFRSGDKILSLDQKKISNFLDINQYIEHHPESKITALINRKYSLTNSISFVTKKITNPNPVAEKEIIGSLQGLDFRAQSPIIWINKNSPLFALLNLSKTKKTKHNIIKISSINNKKISYLWELKQELLFAILNKTKSIDLKIENTIKRFSVVLPIPLSKISINTSWFTQAIKKKINIKKLNTENILNVLNIQACDLCLGLIQKNSPAEKAGLKVTDKLVSINLQKLNHWQDVPKIIKNFKTDKKPLTVAFIRNNQIKTLKISPNEKTITLFNGEKEKRFMLGIAPLLELNIKFTLKKITGFFAIIKYGGVQAIKWTKLTIISIVRMFENKISSKNLAGVLSIGKMAKDSLAVSWYAFFKLMAIISINLFLLNLMPIPVLDGGHLLIYTIEAVRGGKKLSVRKIEIAQGLGFVLLMSLMIYSLFNDIMRFL